MCPLILAKGLRPPIRTEQHRTPRQTNASEIIIQAIGSGRRTGGEARRRAAGRIPGEECLTGQRACGYFLGTMWRPPKVGWGYLPISTEFWGVTVFVCYHHSPPIRKYVCCAPRPLSALCTGQPDTKHTSYPQITFLRFRRPFGLYQDK